MRIKIFFLILALAFSVGFIGSAEAQTATFPAGCASGLGYSVTTGDPCNGEDVAIEGFVPGCTSATGFSTIDGDPCSGTNVGITWLAGCSSIFGYSTINGYPCNGTATATVVGTTPPLPSYSGSGSGTGGSPGFPTTGSETLPNFLFLGSTALIAALGLVFLSRKSRA